MNALSVKEIRQKIGVSQKELANRLGIHWRTLQNWEKSGNIPLDEYTKICALLPESELMAHPFYGGGTEEEPPKYALPLISIEAVAGFPTMDNDGVSINDCEMYNVPEFASKGAQYLIRVSGSSMHPSYANGDILACRKIDSITFFQWGKVYVLDTNQGALVKRLYEDKEHGDNVICHSDNAELYPRFSIPRDEIRSLSIVVGVIRIE